LHKIVGGAETQEELVAWENNMTIMETNWASVFMNL